MVAMHKTSARRRRRASTFLVTGAGLAVVAGITGLAGAAFTALGVATAVRRRVERMDLSSAEQLARQLWGRANTAVTTRADTLRGR